MLNEWLASGALPYVVAGLLLLIVVLGLLLRRPNKTPSASIPKPESAKPVDATEQEATTQPTSVEPEPEPELKQSLSARLRSGLQKTRNQLGDQLAQLLSSGHKIDEELLEDIESQLIMTDMGVEATQQIISSLTERLERKELRDPSALYSALKDELAAILSPCAQSLNIPVSDKPFVILMVGVNGAGKTTTIGKLAKQFLAQGKSVMLAAGDTFRAAAVEQLQTWGERNGVPVVAQQTGSDSASVIFDALASAQSRGIDILIADTAGRLQNKDNLMNELSKIKRVMGKLDPHAPHEVMLVLDAATGQNALSQARLFNEAVGVTGITLTKLDGTAKGGVIFAIASQLQLPVRYIGVGEKIDDLRPFEAKEFVAALFDSED